MLIITQMMLVKGGWETIPQNTLERKLREEDGCIIVNDGVLINALNKPDYQLAPLGSEALFVGDGPKYKDIYQNDERGTCYLLSTGGSFLASENSKAALINMFSLRESEQAVVVEFNNSLSEGTVKIKVSLPSVFVKGKSIYSYSSVGGVWPAILEKATHGFNLALRQYYMEQKNNEKTAEYLEQLRAKLGDALNDKNMATLDYANLMSAMERFPLVQPDIERLKNYSSQLASDWSNGGKVVAKQVTSQRFGHPDESDFSKQDWDESKKQLSLCLASGVPVILGTRKEREEKGWFKKGKSWYRAIRSGSLPGHAVAVLKNHVVQTQEGPVKGVLIFDPYGAKMGSAQNLSVEDILSLENFSPANGEAVQFVKWSDVPIRFSQVAMAKGCPVISKNLGAPQV